MAAFIIIRDQTYEVRHGMSVRSALVKLSIPLYAVLPILDGELIHEETILQKGQTVELVLVMSGGLPE